MLMSKCCKDVVTIEGFSCVMYYTCFNCGRHCETFHGGIESAIEPITTTTKKDDDL